MRGPTGRLTAYAVAAGLARSADEGARVLMRLLALQRLGDAAAGGLLVAALLAPRVLGAPLVGMLADRSPRPATLVAGAAAGFGGTLALTATLIGRVPIG